MAPSSRGSNLQLLGSQCRKAPNSRESQSKGSCAHLCKSLSCLYALVMVTWYLALASTKIISYENYFHHLNEDLFEVWSSNVLISPWLNNQGVLLIPGVAPYTLHHVRCLCPLLCHMSKLVLEVVFSKNGCRESQGIVDKWWIYPKVHFCIIILLRATPVLLFGSGLSCSVSSTWPTSLWSSLPS